MSTQQHTINVNPPKYQKVHENMVFRNYDCPVCNGRGSFTEQTGPKEWSSTLCDYCDGTGKVKAVVNIKWQPDYE